MVGQFPELLSAAVVALVAMHAKVRGEVNYPPKCRDTPPADNKRVLGHRSCRGPVDKARLIQVQLLFQSTALRMVHIADTLCVRQ